MTLFNSATKFALLGGTAVGLALSAAAPAQAASMVDRGLERRVSDLEAEVRLLKNRVKALEDRKLAIPDKIVVSGNSRVKVTLYGQVNRAVRFYMSQDDGSINHVDNDASSSRIGILARGRLFPDVTISALTELEWQDNRRSFTGDHNEGNVRVRSRFVDLWFTHADLGSLYMGQGDTAADAASLFSLSGTSIVWASHGADDGIRLGGVPAGSPAQTVAANAIFPGLYYAPTTGRRFNRIMYASPRIAGFQFRVSHSDRDVIDAAVRYAGSPFGLTDIRVLGAFGFIYAPNGGTTIPGITGGASNTYAGSLGVLHVPTGLNINGMAATTVAHGNNPPGIMNQSFWYIEGGWQGRIWAMGKSYWSVGTGNWNGGIALAANNDIHAWRINTAFVQEIDSAATDIYAGYAYYDAKRQGAGLDAGHVIVIGARIKF